MYSNKGVSIEDRKARGNKLRHQLIIFTAEGRPNSEIAFVLKVSPKTIDYHKKIIACELGLPWFNVALVTRWAVYNGLVPAGLPANKGVKETP